MRNISGSLDNKMANGMLPVIDAELKPLKGRQMLGEIIVGF
jgi:hypothetical protein